MLGRKGQVNTIKEQEQTLEQHNKDYYKFNKSEVLEENGRDHIRNITYEPNIK